MLYRLIIVIFTLDVIPNFRSFLACPKFGLCEHQRGSAAEALEELEE